MLHLGKSLIPSMIGWMRPGLREKSSSSAGDQLDVVKTTLLEVSIADLRTVPMPDFEPSESSPSIGLSRQCRGREAAPRSNRSRTLRPESDRRWRRDRVCTPLHDPSLQSRTRIHRIERSSRQYSYDVDSIEWTGKRLCSIGHRRYSSSVSG